MWYLGGSVFFCFFKQKTAYEMRISDWSSDVCSSDLFRIGEIRDHPDVALLGEVDDRLVEGKIDGHRRRIGREADDQGNRCRHAEIGRASCRARVGQYV